MLSRSAKRLMAGLTGLAMAASGLAVDLVAPTSARAATGDVDPSFATNGASFTNLHTVAQSDVVVRASAVTADAKLVVVGDTRVDTRNTDRDVVVMRFGADGVLDTTFGTAGRTVFGTGALTKDEARDVAISADGHILVAGSVTHPAGGGNSSALLFARLTADGALDPTFDTDGVVVLDLNAPGNAYVERPYAIVAESDNSVRVAAHTRLQGAAIVALDANGALDPAFDGDGIALLPASGGVVDLARQSDGTLVALVRTTYPAPSVMRVSPTGSVLSTTPLGSVGLASCDNWFDPDLCALTVDHADRIVVAARGSTGSLVVARLSAVGTVDASFGGSGSYAPPVTDSIYPLGITVDATDAVLVAGSQQPEVSPGTYEVVDVAVKLTAAGLPDAAFGINGIATVSVGAPSPYAFDIESIDGDVALVGYAQHDFTGQQLAMGLLSGTTGALVPGFGTAGIVLHPLATNHTLDDTIEATVVDASGRIVGVGYTDTGVLLFPTQSYYSGQRTLIARWTADGALDPTFGTGGLAIIDTGADNQTARAVALDSLGRIVVGAVGPDGTAVLRLLADGTLDPAFGTGGLASDPLLQLPYFDDLSVDGADRVLVAGRQTTPTIVRLATDGRVDTSFGVGGAITSTFGFINSPSAVQVHGEPDGRVTIAASGRIPGTPSPPFVAALERYVPDGSPDLTFGTAGRSLVATIGTLGELTVDAAGRVLVAGANNGVIGLARFSPTGAPDGSFGGSGRALASLPPVSRTVRAASLAFDAFGNVVVVAAGADPVDYNRARPVNGGSILLARFGENGVDISFGASGVLERTVSADDRPTGIAVQPNGRIVVAGTFEPTAGYGTDLGVAAFEGQATTGGDTDAPTVTVNLTDGQQVSRFDNTVLTFSCDDTGGSGLASCSGPGAGSSVVTALGISVGTASLHFRAIDRGGNVTDRVVTVEILDDGVQNSSTNVSTLGSATEASATDPVETRLTYRASGAQPRITERPGPQTAAGYALLPWRVETSGGVATASLPHQLTFWLDSSLLGTLGLTAANAVVLLDGSPVVPCAPSVLPCVSAIATLPSGDLQIAVNARTLGSFTFGIVTAPTDLAPPTVDLVTPASGATYALGQAVTASYTCSDDVAIASCVGTVANGAALGTATPGAGPFTVTATDTAGKITTVTSGYTVTNTFASGLALTGSLTTIPAGYTVTATDSGADGVTITVTGAGTDKVVLSVCATASNPTGFTIRITPGSTVTLACGSVIVKTVAGIAEIVLPFDTILTVPQLVTTEVDAGTAPGTFRILEVTGGSIAVQQPGKPPSEITTPSTVNVDRIAPVVTVTGVTPGAAYTLGAVPAAGCSTTDNLSGVATPARLTVKTTGSIGVGAFTATCAGAADVAGNPQAGPVSVTYTVVYRFDGFTALGAQALSPTTFRATAGLPILFTWTLRSANGAPVTNPAAIKKVTITPSGGMPRNVTTTALLGSFWALVTTERSWVNNVATLTVTLADTTVHTATISLQAARR